MEKKIKTTTIKKTEVKETTSSALPKEIFGAKINPPLMAQAVKVYLSNQRKARASAQTRATVNRTKAKWFRQKGTGRARHGARSAPIFVGGGKAHGPTGEQNYRQSLSKKMVRAAILSALSFKAKENDVALIPELDKIKKTRELKAILAKFQDKKGSFLLVLPKKEENVFLAGRNLKNLEIILAGSLTPYLILKSTQILILKDSLKVMEDLWGKE